MNQPRVLLLEDELQLARIISETLSGRGFTITQYNNGRDGLDAVYKSHFDVCVVDVMMPFMDGFTFVKELRKANQILPVLFLTSRSQDQDVAEGYTSGGNDYLRKPFSLEELIFRINELLKRKVNPDPSEPMPIGNFIFYSFRQELVNRNDGKIIRLSYRESELLLLLIEHKNQLLDRRKTLLKLWGDDNPFHARTMDVFISKLRKHFFDDKSIEIINLRGKGYKLLA
ncbi:MAG TPA: response regulator transcription factor [Pedobacter sp.]|jgi:DNA-binding response OmpR family regulator